MAENRASASKPAGTCEFAMNSAFSGATSAAKLAANLALGEFPEAASGRQVLVSQFYLVKLSQAGLKMRGFYQGTVRPR